MRSVLCPTVKRSRLVIAGALLVTLFAAVLMVPALHGLGSGGTLAVDTEAARAERRAVELGVPPADLILSLSTEPAAQHSYQPVSAADRSVVGLLSRDEDVLAVRSPGTTGDAWLLSDDRRASLITVSLSGDERQQARTAERLVDRVRESVPELTVGAGGRAWITAQIDRQCADDLLRAELLAAPAVLLVLLIAYGSLVCALLPVLIATLAVTCTVPVVALLARVTDVSVFAVNAAVAIGFGLAVDYTLFLLSRYQEELRRGASRAAALSTAMRTSGRSVAFSAGAVATCLACSLLVPIPLLRDLAVAGITVSMLAAAAALLVLPSLLVLLGDHLDRGDPLRRMRRSALGDASRFWRSAARRVTTRPVLAATAAVLALVAMALPFTRVHLDVIDQRSLPATASGAVDSARIAARFAHPPERVLTVISDLSLSSEAGRRAWADFRRDVAALPHATEIRMVPRRPGTPPASPSVVLVATDVDPASRQAADLVHALRAVPGTALVGGRAAEIGDTVHAVRRSLPQVAWLLAAALAVLLGAFTRSVVIPLKAVTVAALSLGASVGALVVVFQFGHGSGVLGHFTVTGGLDASLLLFTLAIALALSVDYEVFLLGRIKEAFDRTGDNTEAVIDGIARTGRLMTSAAAAVAVSTAALTTSQVTALKVLGLGVALAALTDAVVIRGILVPAVMTALGPANWWSPTLYRRIRHRDRDSGGRPGSRDPQPCPPGPTPPAAASEGQAL
ncbi:MMPL family transporter [Streptomyces sp. NPDC012769]|uniref:MMPL family transporter n=1 Tax=Streptomyces sp. NPDC012769 TaxID=3364848 RepID=UPI0036937130